jgi:hypothetical protein
MKGIARLYGGEHDFENKRWDRYLGNGRWFVPVLLADSYQSITMSSWTEGIIYAYPFFLPMTKLFDYFGFQVSALGANTFMRFGVYTNKPHSAFGDLYPHKLVYASAEYDCQTSDVRSEAINPMLSLPGGKIHWMAHLISNTNGGLMGYGSSTMTIPNFYLGYSDPTGGKARGWRGYQTYGALPSIFPDAFDNWNYPWPFVFFGQGR